MSIDLAKTGEDQVWQDVHCRMSISRALLWVQRIWQWGSKAPTLKELAFCSVFTWGYWKERCVVKYERPQMGLSQRDFNGMGLFRKGNRDVHLRGEALASWRVSRVSVLSVLQCVDDFTDSTWSGCREGQVPNFMARTRGLWTPFYLRTWGPSRQFFELIFDSMHVYR